MDTLARFAHRIVNKILKKRRRSIGHQGADDLKGRLPPPRLSMDDSEEEKEPSPPSTPSHIRSRAMLRAATPAKTRGILVHEGESTVERSKMDAVSQAESCVDWEEWNEPAHDVPVDSPFEFALSGGDAESPSEFAISGGDDSTSVGCEEEQEKEESLEDCEPEDFVFHEEYIEDDFEQIAELQKMFPVQKKMNGEYYWQPTHMVEEDEGYYWDEPIGYSNPALAPPVPSPLAFPALCSYDEEGLVKIAKTVMEEDELAMREDKTKVITKKSDATYIVNFDISPSVRPDTPTTMREEEEESSASGESDGASAPSVVPSSSPFFPSRPNGAKDEDNEWLRSLYEKSGLKDFTPDWMKSDPPKKEMAQRGWATSTPVASVTSPATFSSISTIGGGRGLLLDDSNRTFSSPRLDGSILSVGGATYNLDIGVRSRAALMKKGGDYYKTAFVDEMD